MQHAKLLCLSVSLFVGGCFGTSVRAQETSSQGRPAPLPESAEVLRVAPAAEQVFLVTIPAGQVRRVAFEQRQGSIQVRWKPESDGPNNDVAKPEEARTNRSGRLASVTFHVLGLGETGKPNMEVHGSLIVTNLGKATAEFRVLAGPLHPPEAADAAMLEAERDEAAAFASPHTPAGAQASLPLLQAAAAQWRAAAKPAEAARALTQEIYNQAFTANDGAGALLKLPPLLDLAAQIAESDPTEAGNATKTAGFLCAKQAKYDEAMTAYNTALHLFEKTDDTFNRVVVLENRAKVERIQAHYALALKDVEAALPLTQQSGDSRGELALEVEHGAIASASGQLGVAYEADLRAVSLAQKTPSPFLEGVAWSDLAVAYTEMHDFAEAARALDRADAIWKASANAYGQFQTQEDRAELQLAEGDLAAARASFAAGAETAAKDSLAREHAYFLRGLSVAEMRSGKTPDALAHLNQAVAEAEKTHVNDELSALYASRGDVHALAHRWPEASADWTRADALAQDSGDTLGRVIALGGLIRAAMQTGNLDLAGERCGQAMTALESIRGQISDADLRLSFFSSRHALYDLCVQTALRSHDQQAAFDAAERGRARSLLDEAAAAGVMAELPAGALERLAQNEKQLAAARKQLAGARKRQVDASVSELLKQRDDIRTEAEQSGLIGRLAADSLPLSQAEIVRKLDASTALVAYWLGPNGSVAWLITSRGASVYTLPAARTLEEFSRHYLESLLAPLLLDQSASAPASAEDRSHAIASAETSALRQGLALRRTLLPMTIPPHIRRLLIVKDGALLPVSFSALPLAEGGYLGSRFELATEPSAAFAWRSIRPAPAELRSVIFTDPGNSTSQPTIHTASLSRTSWTAPLPFARREGQELQQVFGERNTRVFAGPAATRANALALDWSRYDLAHFATHAVFRVTHPELSGLVLAASSPGPSSGPDNISAGPARESLLSFYDVLQMKAPLQLVVLNACSSGMGKLVPGEGKLALDNAFLAAGAARVIATLWPVEDEASSLFMHDFYRALVRTRSPTLSLKEAQQKMAETEEWSAPYYWGAFTLSGDWHPLSH